MNLILLGPQGSGKGTQAELLSKRYNLAYVEMGEILRDTAASGTKVGETIKDYQARGELVPDEYTHILLNSFITENESKTGYLFDGFPRTVIQYQDVKKTLKDIGLKIDWVINLHISEEETIRRLSARRVCPRCGEIWNVLTRPSPKEDMCGVCGTLLTHRDDDKPEAIKKRLEWSKSKVGPIIELAREEGILLEVNGERPIEVIYQDIVSKLENA